MKKFLFLPIFALALIVQSKAQPPRNLERIEALKVAFFTQKLRLNAEEAQKFWPVYNSYFEEIKKAKQANKEDELAFQEEALTIRKKYKIEFKKILVDDKRVNLVFKADADFRHELQKELQKRIQERRNRSQKEPE
ncbi:MAG: hypothetical protein MUE72_03870 [Chitinophagaceae bacterium]|jgi:Zn-dependent M16 (insulinase) family peptidase|nr:hypothetical protein [Chitinophagaceae bacterium]